MRLSWRGAQPKCLRRMAVLPVAALLLWAGRVFAWDAATTHAGLTERALEASKFHAVLAHQMGLALGAFEPLKIDRAAIDADTLRGLKSRLDLLDSAGGYRPSAEGVATAIAWVKAGAVLAKTPPERGRNHFLEPRTRTGLDDSPGLSGFAHAARLTLGEGASLRDAATGTAFDLEGSPATAWLWADQNDLGLSAFVDNWELSVAAKEPGRRENALVRALLALGGIMSALEDMGQPAFVRNDFRGEFSDQGSALEIFVADRYGAVALPRSATPIPRPDLRSFFVADDGKGLAQLTQQRFFSAGTLPKDFTCVPGDGDLEAAGLVNQTLGFAEPKFDVLELRQSDRPHYLVRDGVKIAAYRRVGNKIHFFLDKAVYADLARTWLPEVMAYAAGLVDDLLGGKLQLGLASDHVTIALSAVRGEPGGPVEARVFAEDEAGMRRQVATVGLNGGEPVVIALPKGARRIAAVARGRDSAGGFIATGELSLP